MASGLSLGLIALPGNILAISKIGRSFARKIRVYRNAPEIVSQMNEFGKELYQGQFYLDLKIAQAFAADSNDLTLEQQLDSQIKRIKGGLDEAVKVLAKSYDDDGEIDKKRFTLSVEKHLRKTLQDLRSWQAEFYVMVNSLDLLRRWSTGMKLTHDKFLPSINDQDSYCRPISGTSHAYLGRAEWKKDSGEQRTGPILFESHEIGARVPKQVLEALLYLAAHLPQHPFPDTGILRCLGYREEPVPELIFEIPPAYSEPRTLRDFLDDCGINTENENFATTDKLKFAHRISTAVFNAQEAGVVHKHIRPDSILVFDDEHGDVSFNHRTKWIPFLTNWTLARSKEMLSYKNGTNDWQQNLYRHPQRQGVQLDENYHAGHDIYSLGVCLLEIGLGESLIRPDENDDPTLCQKFKIEAIKMQLVETRKYARIACINLKPLERKRVLIELSQTELPNIMGPRYAETVRRCLQCNEEGFGDIQDLKHEGNNVSPVIRKQVLEPLEELILHETS
ncbi:MAG: hypothetical protein Q9166_001731 [cf. Caloplaca sp. 2 TL-2023]